MKFKFFVLLSVCVLITALLVSASDPLKVTWTTGADASTPATGATDSAIIKVPFPGFEGEAPISTTSKECQECKTILQCLACIDKLFVEGIFSK